MAIQIPNIPDVSGPTVNKDKQLRELLVAIKITLEQITGATSTELAALLDKNQ